MSPGTLSLGIFLLVSSPKTKPGNELNCKPLLSLPSGWIQILFHVSPQNDNLEFLLHQKLGEFHFNYHCLGPANTLKCTGKQLASTNAATQPEAFYTRLAEICAVLRSLFVVSNSFDLYITASFPLVTEQFILKLLPSLASANDSIVSSHEDEKHFLNFIWKSPSHALLYNNKIVWNGSGDPVKHFDIISKNSLAWSLSRSFSPYSELDKSLFVLSWVHAIIQRRLRERARFWRNYTPRLYERTLIELKVTTHDWRWQWNGNSC